MRLKKKVIEIPALTHFRCQRPKFQPAQNRRFYSVNKIKLDYKRQSFIFESLKILIRTLTFEARAHTLATSKVGYNVTPHANFPKKTERKIDANLEMSPVTRLLFDFR